jgi:hypothetical protein
VSEAGRPGVTLPQPDTAVASSFTIAVRWGDRSPRHSRCWLGPPRPARALALSLLWWAMTATACFNPVYIGKVEPRENHVPIVEAFPPPTFEPLQADVGDGCAPLSIPITTLDDADGDELTVRFDALVSRNGRAARVELRESPPIGPSTEGSYPLTALTTLTLDEELLAARLGDLERQMDPRNNLTQLIELRVSDAGFVTDDNGDPVADADGGIVFLSWMIRLTACGVEP